MISNIGLSPNRASQNISINSVSSLPKQCTIFVSKFFLPRQSDAIKRKALGHGLMQINRRRSRSHCRVRHRAAGEHHLGSIGPWRSVHCRIPKRLRNADPRSPVWGAPSASRNQPRYLAGGPPRRQRLRSSAPVVSGSKQSKREYRHWSGTYQEKLYHYDAVLSHRRSIDRAASCAELPHPETLAGADCAAGFLC